MFFEYKIWTSCTIWKNDFQLIKNGSISCTIEKELLYIEMGTLDFFSFPSFIVCKQPISFVFFNRSKKFIRFIFKTIIHSPSISFVFSLKYRSIKSIVLYNCLFNTIVYSGKKKYFFWNLFRKIFRTVINYPVKFVWTIFNRSAFFVFKKRKIFYFFEQSISFVFFGNDILYHKKCCSFSKMSMPISNCTCKYLWVLPLLLRSKLWCQNYSCAAAGNNQFKKKLNEFRTVVK